MPYVSAVSRRMSIVACHRFVLKKGNISQFCTGYIYVRFEDFFDVHFVSI